MKTLLKAITTGTFILFISMAAFAQKPEPNIGVSAILKPKVGMAYEYDQALAYYTKTFRTDSAYAVRVLRVAGGPRGGYDMMVEPLKTWTELDAPRPYSGDAASRAWQNVLKLCDDVQINYYAYDSKNSNPLAKSTSNTKYVSYIWIVDPKADEDSFYEEIKKTTNVLKQAGYHFSLTNSLSGEVKYQIQIQLENGWKEMDKKKAPFKEIFQKVYPGKGVWENHTRIMESSSKDFYVEYRTIRSTVSTR